MYHKFYVNTMDGTKKVKYPYPSQSVSPLSGKHAIDLKGIRLRIYFVKTDTRMTSRRTGTNRPGHEIP